MNKETIVNKLNKLNKIGDIIGYIMYVLPMIWLILAVTSAIVNEPFQSVMFNLLIGATILLAITSIIGLYLIHKIDLLEKMLIGGRAK